MLGQMLPLLLFPPIITPDDGTPQEFSLQFWDDQKVANTSLVVGILSMLVSATASNLVSFLAYLALRFDKGHAETSGTLHDYQMSLRIGPVFKRTNSAQNPGDTFSPSFAYAYQCLHTTRPGDQPPFELPRASYSRTRNEWRRMG